MAEHLAKICFAALCLAAAVLPAGCASHKPTRDTELAQLDEWLPGRYDNQGQITADSKAGRPPHEPLALWVVPVDALQMGHHVFYVEESAGHVDVASAPRLILAQHLVSVEVVGGKIIAALYSFTDPQRWRDGITMPEMFSALQTPDVKLMRGCGLTFTGEPQKFVAANDPTRCLTSSALTGSSESLSIHVEVTREEIAVSTGSVEAGGANPAADSYIRFRRSEGP